MLVSNDLRVDVKKMGHREEEFTDEVGQDLRSMQEIVKHKVKRCELSVELAAGHVMHWDTHSVSDIESFLSIAFEISRQKNRVDTDVDDCLHII